MVWIMIGLLVVAALAPLAVALDRGSRSRGAKDPAVALHKAQLAELDRDLAEARILPAEHAVAVLEVQRRLLAVAAAPEAAAQTGSRTPILAVALLVPAAALALYLIGGQPALPSVTPGSGEARQQRAMEEAALIAQLRQRLETMDPNTDQAARATRCWATWRRPGATTPPPSPPGAPPSPAGSTRRSPSAWPTPSRAWKAPCPRARPP